MPRNSDIDKITFYVLNDIVKMKYLYNSTIRNGIHAKMAIFSIILTAEEQEQAFREIKDGIKTLGFCIDETDIKIP